MPEYDEMANMPSGPETPTAEELVMQPASECAKPPATAIHKALAKMTARVERMEHTYRENHTRCDLCPDLKDAHEMLDQVEL